MDGNFRFFLGAKITTEQKLMSLRYFKMCGVCTINNYTDIQTSLGYMAMVLKPSILLAIL